jgi:hypothetical protein
VVDLPPVPPEGYELLYNNSFGAQIFTSFLRSFEGLPEGLAPENEAEVNESWLGDRIYFYRDTKSEAMIVLWRLRLSDTSLTGILEADFQGGSELRRARMLDNGDLLLAAATTSEAVAALEAASDSAASGETMSQEDLATKEAALPPLPHPIRLR